MNDEEIKELDCKTATMILNECNTGSNEEDHIRADDLLTELLSRIGYLETVAAFNSVKKWYA